jgi:predicted Zn-dependent peptidase
MTLALALLTTFIAPTLAAETNDTQEVQLKIPYTEVFLENGLQLLLSEDHDVPTVFVDVWYHVGSKDEVEGRSGFAHLFEHLMFQGSENRNTDYFVPLQAVGASINGTTSTDRTNYFEGLPAEHLPLALWLEADRMGWLVLNEERLANQQDVVRNERRQRYENPPYGDVWVTLLGNVYAAGHPYHHPTIGNHEDLEAATIEDVKAFYSKWYTPDNATLAIVGDIDIEATKALVERYFGAIPRSETAVERKKPERVALAEENVIRQERDVPLHKVWIAWPTPAFFTDGDADLDILSSSLVGGSSSRLEKRLVHELRIAKDISAFQASSELSSTFVINATAAAGHSTDELVAEIDIVLAELRETGPTADEIELGKIDYEVRHIAGLASNNAKAEALQRYNHFVNTPDYVAQDLARYSKITPESAKDAANAYLPADKRVVLHVTPKPAEDAESPNNETETEK